MLGFFKKKAKRRRIIKKSGLFDQDYYLKANPDVKNYRGDPLQHYILNGEREGRKPNLIFDPKWYLENNADVRNKDISPLVHYIQSGEKEGRKPSVFFDPSWYLSQSPNLKESSLSPLLHFIRIGQNENLFPSKKVASSLTKANLNLREFIDTYGLSEKSVDKIGHLKTTGKVFNTPISDKTFNSTFKVAIVIHVYYLDMIPSILDYIKNIPVPCSLYFTSPQENLKTLQAILDNDNINNYKIIAHPNKGYDILPFVSLLPELKIEGFDLVCKIHTKKGNAHLENHLQGIGNLWFKLLMDPILGSKQIVSNILDAFKDEKSLGMVGSADMYKSTQHLMYGNELDTTKLISFISNDFDVAQDWGFFAGTIFWAKLDIFDPILSNKPFLKMLSNKAVIETGEVASVFHALERVIGVLPTISNMKTGLSFVTNMNNTEGFVEIQDKISPFAAPLGVGISIQGAYDLLKNYQLIKSNKGFDRAYYLKNRLISSTIALDPEYDFLRYGAYQNRSPNALFSVFSYWGDNYKETIPTRQNAWLHFLKQNNSFPTMPDEKNYLQAVTYIKKSHLFNESKYLAENPDVSKTGLDPLMHYCIHGWKEERELGLSEFDPFWYTAEYLSDYLAPVNPLLHYIVVGNNRGHLPRPQPPKKQLIKTQLPNNPQRICLFAAYDPDGIIDESVILFVKELANYADVYFLSDNRLSNTELQKIKPFTEGAWGIRHGEYDFGSYKRLAKYLVGWELIETYDELLLVNDSSYLIKSLADTFNKMDSKDCSWWGMQATKGLAATRNKPSNQFKEMIPLQTVKGELLQPYESENFYDFLIGSYFLAFRQAVLKGGELKQILNAVSKERNKKNIIIKYEIGITRKLILVGYDFDTVVDHLYPFHPIYTYNIFELIKAGYPLFKRFFLTENHYHEPQLWQWKEKLLAVAPNLDLNPIEQNLYRIADATKLYNNLNILDKPIPLLTNKELIEQDKIITKDMNQWVFPVCSYNHSFSGNERAVFEAVKNDSDINKIILYRSKPIKVSGKNISYIPLKSLEGQQALIQAGVIFVKGNPSDDIVFPLNGSLHKIINLWHGIPLKRIGVASHDSQKFFNYYVQTHQIITAVISSSSIDRMAMTSAFYPLNYRDIWVTGLPRNDFILRKEALLPKDFQSQLKHITNKIQNKKFILFVPTFRNAQADSYYRFNREEKERLFSYLNENNIILGVREHMADTANSYSADLLKCENVIDVSSASFPNIEVLYRKADLLITDYSSCFIDFMLTGKPMISFAYDFEEYMGKERGFFYDMPFVFPGPICKDFECLIKSMINLVETSGREPDQEYLFKRKIFFDYIDDNNATRVVDKVKNLSIYEQA